MTIIATDSLAPRFPVSIKGVVFVDNKLLLLKNEREEWELPGGKLEPGETPRACLTREIKEETGLLVDTAQLLNAYLYNVSGQIEVLIIAYQCRCVGSAEIRISEEHKEIGLFRFDQLDTINLPQGYRDTIDIAKKTTISSTS